MATMAAGLKAGVLLAAMAIGSGAAAKASGPLSRAVVPNRAAAFRTSQRETWELDVA